MIDEKLNPKEFALKEVPYMLLNHDPKQYKISYRRVVFLLSIAENPNESPERQQKASMLYINILNGYYIS